MPLLIYGAAVPFDEDISLDRFVEMVDDESWKEFMPNGVTKEIFADFSKYYDRDVFVSAGKEIRKLAASADELTPTQRVTAITKIFRYFKNPDKETVLTPWRVVNMHMSATVGGWCFYDESFNEELEEPHFVDQGIITANTFCKHNAQILEINSKSGLYPLYVAYSIYRTKLGSRIEGEEKLDELYMLWNQAISESVYVVCKTPMAKFITQRTLLGYRKAPYNAHYFDDLINMLKNKPEQFKKRMLKGSYWKKEVKEMKFDAVVGNPPYQEMDTENGRGASSIFPLFVAGAKSIAPEYISMVIPARWYAGGKNLDEFRDEMLNDNCISSLFDFESSKDCFTTADIAGGICFFLWDADKKTQDCQIANYVNGEINTSTRPLNEYPVFIRSNHAISILRKVLASANEFLGENVLSQKPFGFRTYERGGKRSATNTVRLITSDGIGYVSRDRVTKNAEYIDKYKVIVGRFVPSNGEVDVKPGDGYRVTTTPRILCANEICTETYIVVGIFDTLEEAQNYISYFCSKFFRFMLRLSVSSLNISREIFRFVPSVSLDQSWCDEDLYKLYELSGEEIAYIEKMMKPMNANLPDSIE